MADPPALAWASSSIWEREEAAMAVTGVPFDVTTAQAMRGCARRLRAVLDPRG